MEQDKIESLISYPEIFEKRDLAKMVRDLQGEILKLKYQIREQKAMLFVDLYGPAQLNVDWDKVEWSGKKFLRPFPDLTEIYHWSHLPLLEDEIRIPESVYKCYIVSTKKEPD
jgi:hypothetical protein